MLTGDGVHPNALGNEMMATGILKTFGLTDDQLQQQHKMWLDLPDAAAVKVELKMTPRQLRALQVMAADANQPIDAFMASKLSKQLPDIAAGH